MTETVELGGMRFTIGMPVNGPIQSATVMSLLKTQKRCLECGIVCDVAIVNGGSIEYGRDTVVDEFLSRDSEKLFWIDSDMVWEPDDVFRLLALSTKVDVVCATYPAKVDGPPRCYVDYDPDAPEGPFGLIEVRGVGLGFSVVSRKSMRDLSATKPEVIDDISGRTTRSIFRIDHINGHRRTEDMAFFADLRDLGYRIWLDAGISLGHIGQKQWRHPPKETSQ